MPGVRGRIALVAFGDPHLLPPIRNTAVALTHRGWRVDTLGIRWAGRSAPVAGFPQEVSVILPYEIGPGIAQHLRYLQFLSWCVRRARRAHYDWIIAYDLTGAPIGRAMATVSGARWAYHNLDLVAAPTDMSRSQRLLGYKARELAAARRADLIVFSQHARARIFMEQARITRAPLIVFNCPSRRWNDGVDSLDPRVEALRERHPRLVVYQGGLNLDRGLSVLIESIPHWPADAALVLVGDAPHAGATAAARARITALALDDRVLWTGRLGWAQLPSVTRACALGVLLTPPRAGGLSVELAHLAGASNKIFEYMALGLAVLAPSTEGFAELIEAPGFGELCRDHAPAALGKQIARLLEADAYTSQMRARNRAAFEREFHFEHQLAKVACVLESPRRPPCGRLRR